MLGLVLLYVGAVLFINGLTMLGKIAPKEAAVMNLFAGGISLFVSLIQISTGNESLLRIAAFGLLFSFTYLWIAYIHLTGQDGHGLGWFSLFVAVTAAFVAADAFDKAQSLSQSWMAICWFAWAILWFCYFFIGALQKSSWIRPVAWLTIIQGVLTAWLPGYLMLSGRLA